MKYQLYICNMKNQIYSITNNKNNKVYIGLTTQGNRTRFLHHLYEARSGSKFPIHRAIRKYGEESFEIKVLITLDQSQNPEELKRLEKFYIKEFKANNRKFGYNLTEGGDGTLGKLHSEETKDKIRQKALGRITSFETKQRMSEAHSKNKNEEWYKENKRKAVSILNKLKYSPIEIENIETGEKLNFEFIIDAAKNLNISRDTISKSIKNECIILKKYIARKITKTNLCQQL